MMRQARGDGTDDGFAPASVAAVSHDEQIGSVIGS
jgi:hypothetical protein